MKGGFSNQMRGGFNRRGLQRLLQLLITTVGSVRIKLLLLFGVAFTLFVLTGQVSHLMGWTYIDSSPDPFAGTGYTILINTWKRYDLLKKSIAHYSACGGVDSIHVVWSEPNPPADSLVKYLRHLVKIKSIERREVTLVFDINKEDSLNNRFKEVNLKYDAVFSIDDDVIFPCSSVEFAFNIWRSAPDAMVGYVPRVHWMEKSDTTSNYYNYGGWWSVWWTGTYSMILSKAAFLHKKYFYIYTHKLPASLRDYVTKNRNCEDIAMSFLVANMTNAPPIWVKGKIFEIGSTGISSLGGHQEKRTLCVNRFVAEFGRMPLVSSSVKAVDSRRTWFW